MKHTLWVFLVSLFLILTFSCKKDPPKVIPILTTTTVTNITSTTASSGGSISNDGGAKVTACGVCWSISQNPTTADFKTLDGISINSFTSSVSGLSPGATYYARAYATNVAGTGYGSQVTITTLAVLPSISTISPSAITGTTATGGGNITSDGGGSVTTRGVCWSTAQNPTIIDSLTTDGTGTGVFTSLITRLTPATTYYLRSYATNSAGTIYGSQVTMTTLAVQPSITTANTFSITTSSITIGGNITSDGGAIVTARGVCWSTSQNPTIANSKTTDGSGSGVFTSTISGLTSGTTYYIKAYATNSVGTAYGAQVATTTTANLPTLTTATISAVTSSSATGGGNITSDGGASVTARGVCWNTSQSPTTANSKTTNGSGLGSFTASITGLLLNTTYYVRAYATTSAGTSYGIQTSFTTTFIVSGYTDAAYRIYQNNTLGSVPCEVLFVGDGYLSSDFELGGLFDQDAAAGIEAFFNVEPYKTYRQYFKVYKQAAYSQESGITQTDKGITKQTCFSTFYKGGSSLETDDVKVFNYAKMIPGVTDTKLRTLLIVLILNQDRYAGTCWMWSNGKAIAICPVSKAPSTRNYANIVYHEAGGHGWAQLGDEYISTANIGKTIPDEDKTSFTTWSAWGYNANVDITNDLTLIKWKDFVGQTGYDRVGAFEGALYYTYGAWRAEVTSCMINNIPYFSAPSREAAVRKIFKVSGGTYTLPNFITNDIQKTPSAAVALMSESFNPITFVPLAPPVRKY